MMERFTGQQLKGLMKKGEEVFTEVLDPEVKGLSDLLLVNVVL